MRPKEEIQKKIQEITTEIYSIPLQERLIPEKQKYIQNLMTIKMTLIWVLECKISQINFGEIAE